MYEEAIKFHKTFGVAFIIICLAFYLIGCGPKAKFHSVKAKPDEGCSITEIDEGAIINCGGNLVFIGDGSDGKDGTNGNDGQNGSDAVSLTKINAPKNKCTKVSDNIWVENIQNGKVFDVYSNSNCADNQGEYCDNVVPSNDKTGKVEEYRGSGTVCWSGNIQLSGVKQDNGDILIYMLDFN